MLEDIEFSSPQLLETLVKIPLTDPKNIDYSSLDDRDFEILLYSLTKRKILESKYLGQYDDIQLLSGIRDKGRDCALFYNSNQVGLIQCKKYAEPLTPTIMAKELLKFLLWSFTDERIFYYTDKQRFNYIFATINGISEDAVNIVNSFSDWLIDCEKFDSWCKTIIKDYSGLQSKINYEEIKPLLIEKIKAIKIYVLQAVDISTDLIAYKDILSSFFTIVGIIQTDALKPLEAKLDRFLAKAEHSNNDIDKIADQIKDSSTILEQVVISSFSNTNNYHIDRAETDNIFNWIQSPTKEQLAFIVGEAGCGKSVIIKDLLQKCRNVDIPTLAIKAEYLKGNSFLELQKILQFPIIDYIRTLAQTSTVVVLVDQIDALSQYLSTTRDYILAYIELIVKLQSIQNTKIVVSTRKFDCDNDPEIHQLAQNSQRFNIATLSKQEVEQVLMKISCTKDNLSSALLDILQTPVYLEVFCRIYSSSQPYINIRTVYELYNRLWDKLVLENKSLPVKDILFAIANDMHSAQEITILARKYREQDHQVIDYLCREHLIEINGGTIQMFHQSFYDYVFAKCFIEKESDLITLLKQQKQSVFIRSTVKMIVSYLREYDQRKYLDTINTIIACPGFKFHIKHLIYNVFGSINHPTKKEKEFVRDVICESDEYLCQFLKNCSSPDWFDHILDNPILYGFNSPKSNLENIQLSLFYRFMGCRTNRIICFISENRELPIFKQENVLGLLSCVDTWTDDTFELLESYVSLSLRDYRHIGLLIKIVNSSTEYVVNILKNQLLDFLKIHKEDNSVKGNEYELLILLKAISEKQPDVVCEILFDAIDQIIYENLDELNTILDRQLLEDKLTQEYEYSDNENNTCFLYQCLDLFITNLINVSNINISVYRQYHTKFLSSNKWIWLYCSIIVLRKTECRERNRLFLDFVNKMSVIDGFAGSHPLQHEAYELLIEVFQNFSEEDQKIIVEILFALNPSWERHIFDKKRPKYFIGNTSYRYLRGLPKSYWVRHKQYRRKFQELQRRWGHYQYDWQHNVVLAGVGVPSPIKSSAYEHMTQKQWIQSFIKYDNGYHRWIGHFPAGGQEQHASAFKRVVKELPDRMLSVIDEIIFRPDINITYKISGVEGLIESKRFPEKSCELFCELMSLSLEDYMHKQLIWAILHNPEGIIVNKKIFDYIVQHAKHNIYEDKDDGSIMYGINSLQGSACMCLIMQYNQVLYKDLIIPIISSISKSCPTGVKAAILYREAFLKWIDEQKAFEIFQQCLASVNNNLVVAAQWSLQYYYNQYAKELSTFFYSAIDCLTEDTVRRNYAIFITQMYLKGNIEYENILNHMVEVHKETISVAIEVALAHYSVPEYKVRCVEILDKFYKLDDENICEAYECGILRDDHHRGMDLKEYLPFLTEYVKSTVFKSGNHHYLIDYLFSQAAKYPKLVLDLLQIIDIQRLIEGNKKGWYRQEEECQKLILGTINYVKDDPKYCAIAIDILDNILKHSRMQDQMMHQIDSI